MKKTIGIIGPIGNFTYKGKEIHGVQLADIVAAVTSAKDLTELVVEYDTPGGEVSTGKSIYSYLKSIQPRVAVTSKQIGDIASIGTHIWFSGSKRLAMKGKKFMAHFPYTPHAEGNADEVQEEVDALRMEQNEMVDFLVDQTGITKEGISPLMKKAYSFGDDRAVELKFATELYAPMKQAAYNPNSTMDPNKEKDSWVDQLIAALKGGKKKDEHVAAAPPAELMGKPVQINGAAAPNGVYTVVGGVVTAMEPVAEEKAEGAAPPAAADKAKLDEIVALLGKQPKQEEIVAAVAKLVDDKLVALKKTITTKHVPEGYTPETSADDAKEWDRSFKANEHVALKKNDPEKYKKLFYAKYGRIPN